MNLMSMYQKLQESSTQNSASHQGKRLNSSASCFTLATVAVLSVVLLAVSCNVWLSCIYDRKLQNLQTEVLATKQQCQQALDKCSNHSNHRYDVRDTSSDVTDDVEDYANDRFEFEGQHGGDGDLHILRNKRSSKRGRKGRNSKKRRGAKKSKFESNVLHMVIAKEHTEPHSPDLITANGSDSAIKFWKETSSMKGQKFAKLKGNGVVTIVDEGLFMIYVQITYYDRSGRWANHIDINGQPLAKCVSSEWGLGVDPETNLYFKTVHQCYTSAAKMLNKGDQVSIKSLYPDRVIHTETTMTYWGIIKLS